ncbi:MAG TPA: DUF4292 domain-containing protein [Bacteroidia bacterium]|nr:DUF4292 domain-containing protein [Bacteroidia bacterium]
MIDNSMPRISILLRAFILSLILVAGSSALSSCRVKKKKKQVAADTTSRPPGNCRLDRKLPRALISEMRKKEFRFEWLSAKLDCEAGDDSTRFSFDVSLRMRRDSVIWMQIMDPVIGIKVARILITKDSVKFVRYIGDGGLPDCSYFSGDFIYLSQLLGTDVDFELMQSLLIGNSVSFYEDDEKLHSSVNENECNYTLSTIRKRKLKKVLDQQKQPDDPLQTISLDPSTFKIMKILFIDSQNRTFTAEYSDMQKEDSLSFPHHAFFNAKGTQKSASIDITYKKISLNKHFDFPFSIPDDCTPIIIPQDQQDKH